MKQIKVLNLKSAILLLKTLENGFLAAIDKNNSLLIIDPSNYKVIKSYKSNIKHTQISNTCVDITPCGKYIVIIVPRNNHQAALFDISQKALLSKEISHQTEVKCVAIDPSRRYCITCTEDGKGFVWVVKTAKLAFTTPSHTDYISVACFDEAGQWIATGSSDCTINIFNATSIRTTFKLRGHNHTIIGLIFLSSTLLISADSNGSVIIWNFCKGIMHKCLDKINDSIVCMTLSSDKHFLFVGTDLGNIALYDLQTMTLIKPNFLSINEKIVSIAFLLDGFQLAVATEEGNINLFLLFEDEANLAQMIRENRYKDFYQAVENNTMLKYSKYYELCEQIWSKRLAKARLYLELADETSAKKVLLAFSDIPAKNTQIIQLLKHHGKYSKFKTYFDEKHYSLAYSLAKEFPILQTTEIYSKMEACWHTQFIKAEICTTSFNGDEQIHAILSPYQGISEKTPYIRQLFEKHRAYLYFKQSLSKQNFFEIFRIASMHPFVTNLNEYKDIINYADKLFIEAQRAYEDGDLFSTKRKCEILLNFPDYSTEAKELLTIIRKKSL